MNKEDLLKKIAQSGYNIGFGAKKHFATFDIVTTAPGIIGFLSMATGVLSLYIDIFATKHMSGFMIILGFLAILINYYNKGIEEYEDKGKKLTGLYNEVNKLYLEVKNSDQEDLSDFSQKLSDIEENFYSNCISKQVLFSDWYAHYKFFWQHQIGWIHEQLQFKFWRDKVPLSFNLFVLVVLISSVIAVAAINYKGLVEVLGICS